MTIRYFTIGEANALLPQLVPLVDRLVQKQAGMGNTTKTIAPLLFTSSDPGGIASQETNELHQSFSEVEQLLDQIEAFGVVVKNASVGLIDFLADFNGRDVYLCWKFGEPSITHYHDLHSGFNGRKPIPSTL